MKELQTIIDVVEFAVAIEKNGKEFYEKVSSNFTDKRVTEIFKKLSEDENQHIVDFTEILDKVKKYSPEQAYPEEYFLYFNKIASNHIFNKENFFKIVFKNIKDAIEAIDIGIDFERQSVDFYENIKKIMHEDSRHLIDKLIEQEKVHEKKLRDQKEKMFS
ncbi:MAG: ferritin family protein [Candidatus Omnitrophica bacterium]|nr:ferritin family protein [Candidatus Omnitrophota bacterium]